MFEPPAEFAGSARVGSREEYDDQYRRSVDDVEGFWLGCRGEKLEWITEPTQALRGGFEDLDYTWFADGTLNVSANCLDRHLSTWRGTKAALIWEGDDGSSAHLHLPAASPRGEPVRERAAQEGGGQGRPSRALPADDPGAADRDARVRTHRRDPLGRVRRILGERASRPDPGLRSEAARHRRRGYPRRPEGAAQGRGRRGALRVPDYRRVRRGPARERRGRHGAGSRHLVASGDGRSRGRGRRTDRADERRGSALHPLHQRFDRQAQGRAPHDRGLPAVRPDDASRQSSTIATRTSSGARPTSAGSPATATSSTARSLPARPRSCSRAFRPTRTPGASGRRREVPGHHLLHRSDRPAGAHAPRRRLARSATTCRVCDCSARSASRSTPRSGSGTTG